MNYNSMTFTGSVISEPVEKDKHLFFNVLNKHSTGHEMNFTVIVRDAKDFAVKKGATVEILNAGFFVKGNQLNLVTDMSNIKELKAQERHESKLTIEGIVESDPTEKGKGYMFDFVSERGEKYRMDFIVIVKDDLMASDIYKKDKVILINADFCMNKGKLYLEVNPSFSHMAVIRKRCNMGIEHI